ncbi:LuxR family transcriptional regulator [Herbiconiux ginsengi]|uniref:AAA ATPase domain-containing protein n=1 Tax=Herbiconiux ginsengi TaxID=381665 RepID=A0A1H3L3V3_9MICO|nr:LuxR family transcriptional regulator [Herbiconiux ginsengi]SDY58565.1 AAA ATPase domain-containing protein [Herbiconiux ginsengi]
MTTGTTEPGPLTEGEWEFEGRDALLDRVTSAIEATPALAVVLLGPTGIGKSRLAAESAARLGASAWSALRLSGRTSVTSLPLGGLSPLFASSGAEDAAPGVDLTTLAADPLSLLAAVTARIRSLGGPGRILVVVDDLQAFDDLSVALLTQLVHSGVVKLLATIGDGAPIPDALLALWSESAAVRIDVPPLDSAASEALLARALGGSVARRTAEELHRAAGGNPLFLRELCAGAVRAGTLVVESGVWQLIGEPVGTPALGEVIARRLRAITPAQLDVIERLAVCQPLPVRELHTPGARTSVTELERAGLVVVRESGGRMLAELAQPHYVGVIRGTMSILRVEDILIEQADIVASADPTPDDAFRVAVWRLDAGQPASPELLLTGARLAQLTHDHALAAKLSQAAIDAGATGGLPHLILADALRRLGDAEGARSAAEAGSAHDQTAPAAELLSVRIASTLALIRHDQPGGIVDALQLLSEADARFPTHSALIAITRSMMLFTVERTGEALAEIETLLHTPGLPAELREMVAMAAAMPLAGLGRWSESQEEVERLLGGGMIARDRAFALFTAASASLVGGSLDVARRWALEALSESVQFDDEVSTRYAELLLGHVLLQIGQVSSATRWLGDAIAGASVKGPKNLHRVALGTLALAHIAAGETDAAETVLRSLRTDAPEGNFHVRLAEAQLTAVRGQPAAAIERLRADAEHHVASGAIYLATALLFQAARIGSRAEGVIPATALTATLRLVADRVAELAASGDSPLFQARAAHTRAVAEPSAIGFTDAGERWLQLGATLSAAEAFAAAGRAARVAGRAHEAAALHDRALHLLESCPGADTSGIRDSAPDVLTRREREVVDLARLGLTSQEIASRLFLSIRTVDNHLQSSYGKLGIGGRRDLIAPSAQTSASPSAPISGSPGPAAR